MGSVFGTLLGEIVSIFGQAVGKSIMLFFILFSTSIMMKFCFYQRTDIWIFGIMALLNFFVGSGFVYFFWYLFLHGFNGQYVPRALPAFPYITTQPLINNINYLIKDTSCNSKKLPQLSKDSAGRYNSPGANFFQKMRYFWFQGEPACYTNDTCLFQTGNPSVDGLIFGKRKDDTSLCDLRYNGIYQLNSWNISGPQGNDKC